MKTVEGEKLQASSSSTDWLLAVGAILSALGVWGGVFVAWTQLKGWKAQSLIQRKSELAEGILSAAYEIDDVMRNVRSPVEDVPAGKRDDKYFIFNEKIRRFNELSASFQLLRKAQVKAKFIIQEAAVDRAIEQLFQARSDFRVAINMLAMYVDNPPQGEDSKKLYRESQRDMYGTYSSSDRIHTSIQDALLKLETLLGPFVRLNGGR